MRRQRLINCVAKSSCDVGARNLTVPRSVSHAAAGREGLHYRLLQAVTRWMVGWFGGLELRTTRSAGSGRVAAAWIFGTWGLVIIIQESIQDLVRGDVHMTSALSEREVWEV